MYQLNFWKKAAYWKKQAEHWQTQAYALDKKLDEEKDKCQEWEDKARYRQGKLDNLQDMVRILMNEFDEVPTLSPALEEAKKLAQSRTPSDVMMENITKMGNAVSSNLEKTREEVVRNHHKRRTLWQWISRKPING